MASHRINLCEMYVDTEMKTAVLEVLDSGRYIKGPVAEKFEHEFAKYCGCKYATATSSGTTALLTAYMALGLKAGDEVIVPSHTFIASVTPFVILGAKPIFVDIDPFNYTLDPADVKNKLTNKTRAIVAVHLYGHPVDMKPLIELANEHDLLVIEDCAQAHGALYYDRKVGTLGDISCFSFFPSKLMTVAGDGGMVLTNNEELAEKTAMIKDHGRRRGNKYKFEIFGLNFRMSELHAAIGRVQLKHLDAWINERRRVAHTYNELLADVNELVLPKEETWAKHTYYLYVIRCARRDALAELLSRHNIATGIHFPIPVHRQPSLKPYVALTRLEVTDKIVDEILSLPMYPGLQRSDIEYIVDVIKKLF
jgi:dTDP-4-amino-4,6-dideoxygalactose transaminase